MSSKIAGTFNPRRVDHLMSDEMLDREARKALTKFTEGLDVAIFEANREIISQKLGELRRESFLRLAVKVAEARAEYTRTALELARHEGLPNPAEIARLRELRTTYDELVAAFDAMERIVERGYLSLPRS
jgi:hypothetical protein